MLMLPHPVKRKQIFQLEITKLGNGNRGVSLAAWVSTVSSHFVRFATGEW